ncbi:PLP-dependent aminotransferase family protein [Pandoraea sp. NPDC090278]|uniref:MocR-like pyridoxine biosynthesis transcription factor PdxR n=1 Tax=Pandoraea sp. NPDC090278 TaxID=3364391 RepID=UPI00383A7AC8
MRRAQDIDLVLKPCPAGMPLQQWLYAEIRQAILSGRLAPGQRLPASRDLATRYKLSRGTVTNAFDQLQAEGYIASAVGRGTYVADMGAQPGMATANKKATAAPTRDKPRQTVTLSARGQLLIRTPFDVDGRPNAPIAFQASQADLQAFPFNVWSRISGSAIRQLRGAMLGDGSARGYLPLRNVIAEHLRTARGVNCTGDDILIFNSVQQILDLAARLLLDPGDAVWMEDPGYPGAHRAFQAAQASLISLPVDAEGVDVAKGIQLAPNAKMAYVTAGHQAPLGSVLSLDRRLRLLEWAKAANAFIVEDDYDSEFRFSGRPLAAMKSLDDADRVIYCGTFSKLLAPGIRIAYAVMPACLIKPFAASLSLTHRYASVFQQTILHRFIDEGHLGRHIRRMRGLYGERADALSSAVTKRLDGLMRLPSITTGLDVPALLTSEINSTSFARIAKNAGIELRPLSFYALERRAPNGFVMGFSAISTENIAKGVLTLARLLDAAD